MHKDRSRRKTRVVVRTDASVRIGTGHVMRALSLAVELRGQGAEVEFVTRLHEGHLAEQIREQGFPVALLPRGDGPAEIGESEYETWLGVPWETDARETMQALVSNPPDWLVVDHYGLDERWECRLRSCCQAMLVVDDLLERHHKCDLLLDQNLQVKTEDDRRRVLGPHIELLLGTRYAMLSPAFKKMRAQRTEPRGKALRRLVIFFGGSDSTNETSKALAALETFPHGTFDVDVVAGVLNRNLSELKSRCERLNYRLHAGGANMPLLYASGDLALGAPGTSTWERMCMGIPSLIVAVAENQECIGRALGEAGCALYLGRSNEVTATTYADALRALPYSTGELERQSLRGMQLVDGQGARRVAAAMMNWWINLKEATPADGQAVLDCRNANDLRTWSFPTEPVSFEDHLRWRQDALSNPDRSLFVAEQRGEPVAVVRLDCDSVDATISLFPVPGQIGKGSNAAVLRAARRWLANKRPEVKRIHADLHREHSPSPGAFCEANHEESSGRSVFNVKQ